MKFIGHWGPAPDALMNSKRLSPADKVVFIALVHFAMNVDSCYPSIHAVAEFAHVCDRTVQQSIRNLQAEHWITGKRISNRKTCFYQLSEPQVGKRCTLDPEQQADMTTEDPMSANGAPIEEMNSKQSCQVRPPSRQTVHPMSANGAPELYPLNYPQEEREKEKDSKPSLHSQEQPAQEKDQANQEPNQTSKQTARQEQARARAAADCTYGEDGQFHLGPVARAWLERRNLEPFILDRLLEDDKIVREAAGPWELIADPLGHVLGLIEASNRLYQAEKERERQQKQELRQHRQKTFTANQSTTAPTPIRKHVSLDEQYQLEQAALNEQKKPGGKA